VELDQSSGADHLNTVFGDCLVKYIDVLGRKGCSRTALEFCKLLLGLNPKQDTHGVLLRLDYYAVRAKEYAYFLDFVKLFSQEVFLEPETNTISNVSLLPNLMLASSLCKRNLSQSESPNQNPSIESALNRLKTAVEEGTVSSLFDSDPTMESAALGVILCLLLYPPMVK